MNFHKFQNYNNSLTDIKGLKFLNKDSITTECYELPSCQK